MVSAAVLVQAWEDRSCCGWPKGRQLCLQNGVWCQKKTPRYAKTTVLSLFCSAVVLVRVNFFSMVFFL